MLIPSAYTTDVIGIRWYYTIGEKWTTLLPSEIDVDFFYSVLRQVHQSTFISFKMIPHLMDTL